MKSIKISHDVKTGTTVSAAFVVVLALAAGCTGPDTGSRSENTVPSPAPGTPMATPMAGHAQHMDGDGHKGHEMAMGQGMSHTMGTTGLESLQKLSGKDFDIAFLSQMIAHHEAAVVMAEQALKNAKNAKTQQDARQVVTAQTREIKQMTDWLQQWYGTTPSKAQQVLVIADMESMMSMSVTTDKMFYEMMVPHHQGAIDMSELALNKAGRPEVKKLAEQIIQAQRAEIADYNKQLPHEQH
ncbi:MAG: DUF305 domain-containing protein [Armatimonadota bacterium]